MVVLPSGPLVLVSLSNVLRSHSTVLLGIASEVTPSGSESWTVPLERPEVMVLEIASNTLFRSSALFAE